MTNQESRKVFLVVVSVVVAVWPLRLLVEAWFDGLAFAVYHHRSSLFGGQWLGHCKRINPLCPTPARTLKSVACWLLHTWVCWLLRATTHVTYACHVAHASLLQQARRFELTPSKKLLARDGVVVGVYCPFYLNACWTVKTTFAGPSHVVHLGLSLADQLAEFF